EIGQVGTQFDGPGHIGTRMEMADGTEQDVFYNGFTIDEMKSPYGLLQLGIEHIKPIITRGILVDVAAYKGVDVLPSSYEVT
ncbi:MAG TPA: cyclase, partial [Candidatus Latescibacteria bacterium]|nr:cyclase [Candidatus Latescibacterota bacterium]